MPATKSGFCFKQRLFFQDRAAVQRLRLNGPQNDSNMALLLVPTLTYRGPQISLRGLSHAPIQVSFRRARCGVVFGRS